MQPVINQDLEQAQVNQMKDEIAALRQELLRHNSAPVGGLQRVMKIEETTSHENVHMELKRFRSEISHYFDHLSSADRIFTSCERSLNLTTQLHEQIQQWRSSFELLRKNAIGLSSKPLSKLSLATDVLLENLDKRGQDLATIQQSVHEKCSENDDLKLQIDSLQVENSKLTAELSQLSDNKVALQSCLFEQQLQILKREETVKTDTSLTEEEKLMKSFRARSEVLISRIEDLDEVSHDTSENGLEKSLLGFPEDSVGDAHSGMGFNINNSTFRRRLSSDDADSEDKPKSYNSTSKNTKSDRSLIKHPNSVGVPTSALNSDLLKTFQKGKEATEKQLGGIESCIKDFSEQLHSLAVIIRRKEELIQVMALNEKEANELTPVLDEKFKGWKKEMDKVSKELEDMQHRLGDQEKRSHATADDRQQVEVEYKKRISHLEEKLQMVEKTQRVAKKLYSFKDNNEKKIEDLEGQIERLRSQQDQLQRKLKDEKDKKMKLESEVKKGEQKVKELQLKTDGQQRVLKRKTEEVAAVQRKLRVGSGKADRSISKLDEQKKILDSEIDKILKRKEEMNELENELKKRQEILEKREALLLEKGFIESRKVRSSQVLCQDIIRLSTRVDDLNQQITHQQDKVSHSKDKGKVQEELANLLRTKAELEKQQSIIEERLQSDHILDDLEERKLKEVVDGIEALDVAIDYKTDLISERQKSVRKSEVAEDWINLLLSKLGEISLDESKALLRKYLEKVATLKESESRAKLEREMFEVQIEEQDLQIHQLQHYLKLTESRATKHRVDQQLQYEEQIQLLLSQLKETSHHKPEEDALRSQDKKIHLLEKELHYYKKCCRDMKRKLREVGDSYASTVTDSYSIERISSSKGLDKQKTSGEVTKDDPSKVSIRSNMDTYRVKNGNPLDDVNLVQSNEIYSLNSIGRESDHLPSSKARNVTDSTREDIAKGTISLSKDGSDMFRLPPVQGSLKDAKSSRGKEQGSSLRHPVERQASDESQLLKDIFESHLSQRISRKENRQQSEQEMSSRKRSTQKETNSSKAHEEIHENNGNPWQ